MLEIFIVNHPWVKCGECVMRLPLTCAPSSGGGRTQPCKARPPGRGSSLDPDCAAAETSWLDPPSDTCKTKQHSQITFTSLYHLGYQQRLSFEKKLKLREIKLKQTIIYQKRNIFQAKLIKYSNYIIPLSFIFDRKVDFS